MNVLRISRRARCFLVPVIALSAFAPRVMADALTADQLIEKAYKALGGENIEKIESYTANTEMTTPMGTITTEVKWLRPELIRVVMVVPQMGEVNMGSDGTVSWVNHPMMGYQLMQGEQADEVRNYAMQAGLLRMHETLKEKFELKGVVEEEFDGAPCYGLRIVKKTDEKKRESTMFFDAESGLLRGFQADQPGPAGPTNTTVTIGEWKEMEGVQFFQSMAIEGGGQMVAAKVTRIVLNTVTPEDVALPEEVKKLTAKPEADEEKEDEEEIKFTDLAPVAKMVAQQILGDLPDDPQELKTRRDSLATAAERMQGDMKQGMKYVIQEIDRLLEDESD
jgi:outer membrane lipoprotein-sorting protein